MKQEAPNSKMNLYIGIPLLIGGFVFWNIVNDILALDGLWGILVGAICSAPFWIGISFTWSYFSTAKKNKNDHQSNNS